MKTIWLILICTGWLLMAGRARAGERLVYAVVHKGQDFLAARTEIYSIDLQTARSSKIFSDEKTPIILSQYLYSPDFPLSGGNKIYAVACQKTPAGR